MLYERLVNKSPQSIQYRDGYGNTLDKLARVYEELERWDKAIESYRSALAAVSRVEWLIATSEQLRSLEIRLGRSPKPVERVLKLAEEATERYPTIGRYWGCLGLAQYREGEFDDAVESLEKADGLIDGGDREHHMVLAMAYWQKGAESGQRHSTRRPPRG